MTMIDEILQRNPADDLEGDDVFRARGDDRRFLARSCLLFAGAFIYVTYALLDSIMQAELSKQLLFLRFGVVTPLLLLIAVVFVKGWFKDRVHLASLAFVTVAAGSIAYMVVAVSGPTASLYPPGLIAVVFAAWMLYLPSFRKTLVMSTAVMTTLGLIFVFSSLSATALYTNLYIVGMGCTVLLIGIFFLENAERSQQDYRSELTKTIDTLRESERRAVELYQEAKLAEKAKNEFLAVVSHELRTPMNAIIGFSEIISTEMLGKIEPPQYQEYSVYIKDSGQQLLSLINDILDVSRAEIDKMAFTMKEFDISATVDSSITACHANAEQAGITVIRATPALHDVMVMGDESRLLQGMTNIIGNAIKFSNQGDTVTVDLTFAPEGALCFTATDTGIGISADDIENIKQPFKQAESAFVRDNGGLGLGLAICNIVAIAHEGTLDIDSQLGQGTTVSITLPSDRVVAAPEQPVAVSA